MPRVVIVTCARWPEISASDALYAGALEARGIEVDHAPWNGPFAPFAGADLIVLRSNWDYHYDRAAFLAWLDPLREGHARVENPPHLVAWNCDKRYLLDLQARGVPIPATRVVDNRADAVIAVMKEFGWERAVVKPAVGASGHAVELVQRERLAKGEGLPTGDAPVLVQEYMPELAAGGEISCVFFDGVFSHAAVRVPPKGEFRVNSQYGGRVEPVTVSDDLIRQARAALAALDGPPPLYARVDGIMRSGAFVLMELEVNEPGLFLTVTSEGAERFAQATVERL